jgi:hypothetical protein
MKRIAFVVLYLLTVSFKADHPHIETSDIDILTGAKWVGKLTYLDYSSSQKTVILSDLIVEKVSGKDNGWTFKNEYPKEPKANGEHVAILQEDGTVFDGETLISRQILPTREIQIITFKADHDNSYRYTYLIGNKTFSIIKEEKGKDDKDYFERNRYDFSR